MPTSDPLAFVRYLDVVLVVLAAPFVVLMGAPMLGYVVGGRRLDRDAASLGVVHRAPRPRARAPRRRSA